MKKNMPLFVFLPESVGQGWLQHQSNIWLTRVVFLVIFFPGSSL